MASSSEPIDVRQDTSEEQGYFTIGEDNNEEE
jgi:hypothetical protein